MPRCSHLLSALALVTLFTAARAEAAAPASCKIQNPQGKTVTIPNCLASCEQKMTERCCNDLLKLLRTNSHGFTAETNKYYSAPTPWQKNFLKSGKNACVFRAPGRIVRETAAVHPESYLVAGGPTVPGGGGTKVPAKVPGITHIILEDTVRTPCTGPKPDKWADPMDIWGDGGQVLAEGAMLHFACASVQIEYAGGALKNPVITPQTQATQNCNLAVFSGPPFNWHTALYEQKVGYFHLPRGK